MQKEAAYQYHDDALAYLQSARNERMATLESMNDEESATLPEPRIAVAVEEDAKGATVALRVMRVDEPTMRMIDDMRERGLVPDDVVIDEVGPLFGFGPRDRVAPLQGGVSCAHEVGERGTLGCFLNRGGQMFLISANHVIARENRAAIGDAVMQPTAVVNHRRIGSLADFERLQPTGNLMDAAIARVEVADVDPRMFNGKRITELRTAPLVKNDAVFKFGQATEERTGRFLGFASNVTLDMRFGHYSFDRHIEIEAAGQAFSCGGDSGALVYDDQDRAVGIVIGGNCVNRTYVTPIDRIITRFGGLA